MARTAVANAQVAERTWRLSQPQIDYVLERLDEINNRAVKRGLTGRYTWSKGSEQYRRPIFATGGVRVAGSVYDADLRLPRANLPRRVRPAGAVPPAWV
jgi:hypothetical protein